MDKHVGHFQLQHFQLRHFQFQPFQLQHFQFQHFQLQHFQLQHFQLQDFVCFRCLFCAVGRLYIKACRCVHRHDDEFLSSFHSWSIHIIVPLLDLIFILWMLDIPLYSHGIFFITSKSTTKKTYQLFGFYPVRRLYSRLVN